MKKYFIPLMVLTQVLLSSCKEKEELTVTGSINGTVTDFQSGQALSEVKVDIVSNANTAFIRQSQQTDDAGKFAFNELEAGNYQLSFSKIYYADNSKDVNVLAGQTVPCDAALSAASHPDFEVQDNVLTGYSGRGGNVVIPDYLGITDIGESVFKQNTSILSVVIPVGVITIGKQAFSVCTALASVTIPNTVTNIADDAFSVCLALTSINFPNSITTIGSGAFASCPVSVSIGKNVKTIGQRAFQSCHNFTVDAENEFFASEGGVLFNKDKSTLIQYPEKQQKTAYTIPGSVTSIGYSAFGNIHNLTAVTIPNSVTSIGNYAFWNCYGLTDITVGWTTPLYISGNLFSAPEKHTLHVPVGTKAAYEAARIWGDLGTIVEY
jgi:hypothetical protein